MRSIQNTEYKSLMMLFAVLLSVPVTGAIPQFKQHIIDKNPTWNKDCPSGQGLLVDIDRDGDLDFTVGAGHWNKVNQRDFYWYENRGNDRWIKHFIGKGYSDAGACAMDVNRDGQIDLFAGEILFINGGQGKNWSRHKVGDWGFGCHDMITADVNRDGQLDIIVHSYKDKFKAGGTAWYESPQDPTQAWIRYTILPLSKLDYHCAVHPGGVGDLDGDGDPDVVTAKYWCENKNGVATEWAYHEYPSLGSHQQQFGWGVKTFCKDMDDDGDLDIVQSEADHQNSDLAWLENDGAGVFERHTIWENSGHDLHTLWVYDYDLDGDSDIFSGSGVLTRDRAQGQADYYQVFLFENTTPKGQKPKTSSWIRHVLLQGHECHNGLAGDVDGDGDIDFVAKNWAPDGPTGRAFILLENVTKVRIQR